MIDRNWRHLPGLKKSFKWGEKGKGGICGIILFVGSGIWCLLLASIVYVFDKFEFSGGGGGPALYPPPPKSTDCPHAFFLKIELDYANDYTNTDTYNRDLAFLKNYLQF